MKLKTREICRNMPCKVLLKTVNSFRKKIKFCLQIDGVTFKHLYPKKGTVTFNSSKCEC